MLYLGLLQDFICQVCKPAYTNCFRDRDGMMGVVEFETADDMDRTIRWVVRGGWGGWFAFLWGQGRIVYVLVCQKKHGQMQVGPVGCLFRTMKRSLSTVTAPGIVFA
jgi:hypothetical protein